jgi:hypothetical protein
VIMLIFPLHPAKSQASKVTGARNGRRWLERA